MTLSGTPTTYPSGSWARGGEVTQRKVETRPFAWPPGSRAGPSAERDTLAQERRRAPGTCFSCLQHLQPQLGVEGLPKGY